MKWPTGWWEKLKGMGSSAERAEVGFSGLSCVGMALAWGHSMGLGTRHSPPMGRLVRECE